MAFEVLDDAIDRTPPLEHGSDNGEGSEVALVGAGSGEVGSRR